MAASSCGAVGVPNSILWAKMVVVVVPVVHVSMGMVVPHVDIVHVAVGWAHLRCQRIVPGLGHGRGRG